jgi:hypothetical protein
MQILKQQHSKPPSLPQLLQPQLGPVQSHHMQT